jgi:nucleotide-binding universal stress UspA family protein
MKVLIAVDDSQESLDAAHFAYRCFGSDSDYLVVSVGQEQISRLPVTPMGGVPPYRVMERERTALYDHARATALAAQSELPEGTPAEADVALGPIGATICAVADEAHSDVIVIGSHDRGIWTRLFHASVSRYLIDNAPCPVLIVR